MTYFVKAVDPETWANLYIKMVEYGEIAFLRNIFELWSYTSLILLCQATLANDGNHADITTDPHIAHFYLNTRVFHFAPSYYKWDFGRCELMWARWISQCYKLGQFALPETCKKWLGLVNICAYSAHQTHEIYQVLPYSVDFKAPGELRNPLSKTVLSKWSFISNKGPVNI